MYSCIHSLGYAFGGGYINVTFMHLYAVETLTMLDYLLQRIRWRLLFGHHCCCRNAGGRTLGWKRQVLAAQMGITVQYAFGSAECWYCRCRSCPAALWLCSIVSRRTFVI